MSKAIFFGVKIQDKVTYRIYKACIVLLCWTKQRTVYVSLLHIFLLFASSIFWLLDRSGGNTHMTMIMRNVCMHDGKAHFFKFMCKDRSWLQPETLQIVLKRGIRVIILILPLNMDFCLTTLACAVANAHEIKTSHEGWDGTNHIFSSSNQFQVTSGSFPVTSFSWYPLNSKTAVWVEACVSIFRLCFLARVHVAALCT